MQILPNIIRSQLKSTHKSLRLYSIPSTQTEEELDKLYKVVELEVKGNDRSQFLITTILVAHASSFKIYMYICSKLSNISNLLAISQLLRLLAQCFYILPIDSYIFFYFLYCKYLIKNVSPSVHNLRCFC